jgi:hypothetical protein
MQQQQVHLWHNGRLQRCHAVKWGQVYNGRMYQCIYLWTSHYSGQAALSGKQSAHANALLCDSSARAFTRWLKMHRLKQLPQHVPGKVLGSSSMYDVSTFMYGLHRFPYQFSSQTWFGLLPNISCTLASE